MADGTTERTRARGPKRRRATYRALADLRERGVGLAAVCTGGMLLAEAGVLDGRPAVTHASARDDLEATDAEVEDARVVDASGHSPAGSATQSHDDGDVLTAGGVISGLDLALHLVARLCGDEVAEQVATTIKYEPHGEVYRTSE